MALERLYGQFSVHVLCDALDVSRGTFYNHIKRNKRSNSSYAKHREELKVLIQQVFEESHQTFRAEKSVQFCMNEVMQPELSLLQN